MNNEVFHPTAPYNFVPLPAAARASDPPLPADRYHADRLTGTIALEITALTDVFVRGTAGPKDAREASKRSEFYAPGGRKALPGSSLRGMLRTLVEIVSESAVRDVDKQTLFYRNLTEPHYRARMTEEVRGLATGYRPRFKAGWVTRDGGRHVLHPCEAFYRVQDDVARVALGADLPALQPDPATATWAQIPVWFKAQDADWDRNHVRISRDGRRTPFWLWYGPVTDLRKEDPGEPNWRKGSLLATGWGPRKHLHWVVPEEAGPPIELPDDLIRDYEESRTQEFDRHEKADFRFVKNQIGAQQRVPCFYLPGPNGSIEFLGHTGMFRLKYARTVADAVPVANRFEHLEGGWDLATAMFGTAAKESRAGRVFVEDAIYAEGDTYDQKKEVTVTLGTPKPSSYQLYLQQPHPNHRITWNDAAGVVRGHKLYWHRAANREGRPAGGAPGENLQMQSPLRPCSAGSVFRGRIRFENLTAVELGALLFALDLRGNEERWRGVHRIGYAKPLGYGSIKIAVKHLTVDDRVRRYRELFTTDSAGPIRWSRPTQTVGADGLVGKFAAWVTDSRDEKGAETLLWLQPRMRSLRQMVTFPGPEIHRTEYSERQVYAQRAPLQSALDVPLRPPRPD